MSEVCSWCKYSPGCPAQEGSGVCDFKDLPFEKQMIIDRVKRESENIKTILGKAAKAGHLIDEGLVDCGDIFAGVKIMMGVLNKDFGVDRAEMESIFKSAGGGELHFMEWMRLAMRLKARRKK